MSYIPLEAGELELYVADGIREAAAQRAYLASPEGERETYLKGLAAQGICASCEGFGDHGSSNEEGDMGRPYICHACGGTGKC